jgi:hypothetical protein
MSFGVATSDASMRITFPYNPASARSKPALVDPRGGGISGFAGLVVPHCTPRCPFSCCADPSTVQLRVDVRADDGGDGASNSVYGLHRWPPTAAPSTYTGSRNSPLRAAEPRSG